jgi:hypothetical protein
MEEFAALIRIESNRIDADAAVDMGVDHDHTARCADHCILIKEVHRPEILLSISSLTRWAVDYVGRIKELLGDSWHQTFRITLHIDQFSPVPSTSVEPAVMEVLGANNIYLELCWMDIPESTG